MPVRYGAMHLRARGTYKPKLSSYHQLPNSVCNTKSDVPVNFTGLLNKVNCHRCLRTIGVIEHIHCAHCDFETTINRDYRTHHSTIHVYANERCHMLYYGTVEYTFKPR